MWEILIATESSRIIGREGCDIVLGASVSKGPQFMFNVISGYALGSRTGDR